MFENMNKLMLAGLGALSMTKEHAERIFDEYVKRGQAEQADKSGFVKEMLDTAERARKEMETIVRREVQRGMDELNVVTRSDLERLESKVDELLRRCAAPGTTPPVK